MAASHRMSLKSILANQRAAAKTSLSGSQLQSPFNDMILSVPISHRLEAQTRPLNDP